MKPYPFHPHVLKPSQTLHSSSSLTCTACEDRILPDSAIHSCPKPDCEFSLHTTCFHLPTTLTHAAHPAHALALVPEPPSHALYYDCNACGDLINAFSFYCQECDFRLHVRCACSVAESVDCKGHAKHGELRLKYEVPDKVGYEDCSFVVCDVCEGCLTRGYWCYGCKECEFCCHLECAFTAEKEKDEAEAVEENEDEDGEEAVEEDEDEDENEEEAVEEDEDKDEEGMSDMARLHIANIKAMDTMAKLNFQMQMAKLNAYTLSTL